MLQIQTPNGLEGIMNDRDAVDLIRTYISDDLAEYVADRIVEFDEVEWRNAQEWASDYRAMEMENEEWRNILDEANSMLQQISYKAEEPGYSKKKMIAEIDKVWQYIDKNL